MTRATAGDVSERTGVPPQRLAVLPDARRISELMIAGVAMERPIDPAGRQPTDRGEAG